jgi:hypothetical protein
MDMPGTGRCMALPDVSVSESLTYLGASLANAAAPVLVKHEA